MGALDGKVALITGAGAGIGRGIARRYAREGASVAVIEIDADNGRRVAAELESLGARSLFVRTDVSSKSDVEAAFAATIERFGRLDVLVNNASKLSPNVLLEQKTDEMLHATLGAGAWATWWFMQLAMPVMREQGGGRIVNFVSVDAEAGAWLHADYNMSKGAIEALTRSAAMEWGRFQILVNAIAPVARTRLTVDATPQTAAGMAKKEGEWDAFTPAHVAPLVAWLRAHVHGLGSSVSTSEIIVRATGKPLDTEVFERHLRTRYLAA